MFGPRFAWPHKCLRNELNKTEYEPTNDRSRYYGSGYLIPAFHGIERTFSWLLSLRLDALLFTRFLSRCGLTALYLATCAQEDSCFQQYRQEEHCQ
jgi:hypothetical protein